MDWTELPVDILIDFVTHLVIMDWIKFSAVCKTWKRAADMAWSLRLRSKPEPPWLMLPGAGDSPQHLAVADFYSFSDGRHLSITLPGPAIQSHVWIGSANGWLVTADDECGLHLLNPISSSQHSLPSITTTGYFDALPRTDGDEDFLNTLGLSSVGWKPTGLKHIGSFPKTYWLEGHTRFVGCCCSIEISAEEIQSSCLLKAVPLWDPSSGEYSIMMMHCPRNRVVFARGRDTKWMPLQTRHRYEDVIVYQGQFYMVTLDGIVQTWGYDDVATPFNPRNVAPQFMSRDEDGSPLYIRKYLAESPNGNLMLILREHSTDQCDSDSDDNVGAIEEENDKDGYNEAHSYHYDPEPELKPDLIIRFQAFILDERPGGSEWREVHDFGGASIFIGCNSATFLLSGRILRLGENRICFT
uniref:F-box domain-containing protein n=1 Tax=Oryza punctata TaxID=4537 RepID=A0A0E0JM86_ORYPU